jgi:hypothetical protein
MSFLTTNELYPLWQCGAIISMLIVGAGFVILYRK